MRRIEKNPASGLKIVYEDADVLVVDKPAGMISGKPDDREGKTLFHLVKQYVGEQPEFHRRQSQVRRERQREISGEETPREQKAWIVHRLDRDVSGLLVFAKTHEAYLSLKDQIKCRQVQRKYLAVVSGQMPITPAGQWKWLESFIKDTGADRPVRFARPAKYETRRKGGGGREGAVRAVTYYRVLAAAHGRSLLVVRLETGQKHQIRVHLAGEGNAIIGDRLYGRGRDSIGRLELHAWELAFAHPTSGKAMRFTAAPPEGLLRHVKVSPEVLKRESESEPDKSGMGILPMHDSRNKMQEQDAPATHGRDARATPEKEKGWDHVAPWYEGLISQHRSDYHEELVVPNVLRLLQPRRGMRVLDVACGEGLLCRRLAEQGVRCVGVDASQQLD